MPRRRTTRPKPAPAPTAAAKDSVRGVTVHWPPVKTFLPDGAVLIKPGRPVVLNSDDEIDTAEAGRILDCTSDWVGRLCDQGKLVEGRDWRRVGQRGNYKIKRAAVLRLRSEVIAP